MSSRFTKVLATVLAAEQAKTPSFEDVSTQRNQLSVLKDEKTQRAFHKMYKEFCNEEDFSRFPAFLQDVDAVFVKHGAKKGDEEGSEDNDVDEE